MATWKEAEEGLRRGEAWRREEWEFAHLRTDTSGGLWRVWDDGSITGFILTNEDANATDWEIVDVTENDIRHPFIIAQAPESRPFPSLRDWYAGQALAGLLANPGMMAPEKTEELARWAINLADAMMELRTPDGGDHGRS